MRKGDRVQTNAKFSKLWPTGAVWYGELIDSREVGEKRTRTVWRVRVDHMIKVQDICEDFLVKEKRR